MTLIKSKTDSTLTRYVMGKLSPEQTNTVDHKLLEDGASMKALSQAESELACDYVCGGLPDEDRACLEARFPESPEMVRKIKLAETFYDKVQQSASLDHDDPIFDYLLGDLPQERLAQLESKAQRDEGLRARADCAEYDLILAYLRGDLSPAQRESFEGHFLCDDSPNHAARIEKLRFAEIFCEYARLNGVGVFARANFVSRLRRRLSARMNLSIGTWSLSRPVWQPVAAIIASLGLIAFSLFLYQSQSPRDRGLNALYATYERERPVVPRLTGFSYARPATSQDGAALQIDQRKRDQAFRTIISLQGEDPETHHAVGLLYLTERRFDDAIDYLRRAAKDDSKNAKIHSDLAAALIAREKAKKPGESSGEGLAEALEHLLLANKLDHTLLPAYFNLALCYQYLYLWKPSAEAWKLYIEKDPGSAWAEEARKRLGEVEAIIKMVGGNRGKDQQEFWDGYKRRDEDLAWQIYKRSRTNTGSHITNALIDEFLLAAFVGKPTEAQDRLQALLFISGMDLVRAGGDRFTHDLANLLKEAPPQRLRQIAAARDSFRAGYALYEKSQIDGAIKSLLRAKELFDQAGDVGESLMAQVWVSHCFYRQGSTKQAREIATQGAQESDAHGHVWLSGLFQNNLANIEGRLTKYSNALAHGLNLLESARKTGDDVGEVRGLNRVSETYVKLAMYREALAKIAEGLSRAAALHAEPAQTIGLLTSASTSYIALDKPLAALAYQKEAVRLAEEMKDPWLKSRHYTHLGLVHEKLNDYKEAVRLISNSEQIGRELKNQLGREIAVHARLHLGQVYRAMGDLDNSVKSYQEAIKLCEEADIDLPARHFSAKKGLLVTRIQQDAVSPEDMEEVIELFEKHRVNIEEESARNSFFNREQSIYDVAIDFTYSKLNDARRAYDYSELSRARSLLDTVNLPQGRLPEGRLPTIRFQRANRPLDLDQIQRRLPDKIVLLQYAVLQDKLIAWVVSRNEVKSRATDIRHDELSRRISEYLQTLRDSLSNKSADYRTLSTNLYDVLIRPVEPWLDKSYEIAIIADKSLNRLPFASLISPLGKYLVEEYLILLAPSSNMYIIATEKARQKDRGQAEQLLSVGNPAFDNKLFNMPYLEDTAAQASEVANFYPSSIVLLGKDAKESTIRKEIGKRHVFHIAMHYVTDERTPMLSTLPLAEEQATAPKERDGLLQTYELYGMDLSLLRLVVLSGCRTGVEGVYDGEGAVGLARAFQGAGIPLVVASLWPTQADLSKGLLVGLHKYRKRDGLSTVKALRMAQLDMIHSDVSQIRNPYNWAAYALYGGHSQN